MKMYERMLFGVKNRDGSSMEREALFILGSTAGLIIRRIHVVESPDEGEI